VIHSRLTENTPFPSMCVVWCVPSPLLLRSRLLPTCLVNFTARRASCRLCGAQLDDDVTKANHLPLVVAHSPADEVEKCRHRVLSCRRRMGKEKEQFIDVNVDAKKRGCRSRESGRECTHRLCSIPPLLLVEVSCCSSCRNPAMRAARKDELDCWWGFRSCSC